MTARDKVKPVRKSRLLPLTVLLAGALALLYFLRFGDFGIGVGSELDRDESEVTIDASVAIDATIEELIALPPCRILLNAGGLSANGAPQTLEDVVSACKEAGAAELIVAGDSTVGQLAETRAALQAAGIELREIHKQPE